MYKISVIVPVYKTEKYLEKCINSIIEQKYTNLEIILVDDGSPDNCPKLCDGFALQDNRIKVIHKKNAGVSAARNIGLDIATGDYITFVDSDDYLEKDMYQSMMKIVGDYKCDFVLCDCYKDFPDRSEIYSHDIRAGYYDYKQLIAEYYPHLLMMENLEYPATISNWLCLFKRELLVDEDNHFIRYPEGVRFSEDLLFGSQVIYNAKSFYYMKGKALYHYYMNEYSASHIYNSEKWNDYKLLYKKAEEYFLHIEWYDFRKQLDLMLLFFLFNVYGDILSLSNLSASEKLEKIQLLLNERTVKEMFLRLKPSELKVNNKLKITYFMLKNNIGIKYLIKKGETDKK